MTHEELLKTIEAFDSNKWGDHNAWSALRAVVELHKPSKTQVVWDTDIPACSACAVEDDYYNVAYPCPTIQAIEKELK